MASKSKRRRRVFRASCILAALIIAGSSFAWFTSKDEVTNRLTATADYGVSIVEDFVPPKAMTPGQTVNKDMSVVNTGSVDAVVRASLENAINATRLTAQDLTTTIQSGKTWFVKDTGEKVEGDAGTVSGSGTTYTAPTTPEGQTRVYDILDFNTAPTALTYNKEYVELSPFEKTNADGTKEANEVTTLMAGGQVVVAGGKSVAPEYQTVRSGDDLNGGYTVIYTATDGKYYMLHTDNKYYEVTKSNDTNGVYSVKSDSSQDSTPAGLKVAALARDYSGTGEYVPQETGLYLFKRSADIVDGGEGTGVTENNNLTHSGFYYDATAGKFYSLYNEQADNTGDKNTAEASNDDTSKSVTVTYTDGVVSKIENVQLAVKEIDLTNNDGTWTVDFLSATDLAGTDTATTAPNTDGTYLRATYHVTADGSDANSHGKDIVYYIKLADNWRENWTYVADAITPKNGTTNAGIGYFYYREVLDSGVTSDKLIDSVTLSGAMTSKNFLDMTYDLNVAIDTAQVTKDEQDKETLTSITGWTEATATLKKDAATDAHPTGSTTISGDGVDGTIDWIDWATP